eukprot:Nitzschia sp. Nitz4//scaffold311_size21207//8656//11803//NITZ4_008621-RA/size21207-processed-gene-0.54-mRNA-1//1//CDS//3329547383//6426//frame0
MAQQQPQQPQQPGGTAGTENGATTTTTTTTDAEAGDEELAVPNSPPVSPMKKNDTADSGSPKRETIEAVPKKSPPKDDAMIKRRAARTVQISSPKKPGAVSISGASPVSKATPSPSRVGRPLVPVGALALPMSAESMHREMQKEPPALVMQEPAPPAVGEIDNPKLEPEQVPVQPPNDDPLVMGTPRANRPSRMAGSATTASAAAAHSSDEDVKARARSGRNNVESVVQPGAVPVVPPKEEPLVMGTPRLNRPSRLTGSGGDSSDEDVKARARSGRNNMESVVQPGAVPVVPPKEEPLVMGTPRLNRPSRLTGSGGDSSDEDVKARARSGRNNMESAVQPGAISASTTSSSVTESIRRREDHAQARAARRMVRESLNEEELQQRFEAKISQLEQHSRGSHTAAGSHTASDGTKEATSKSLVSRRSTDDDRLRRRFDAKMAEADQQFQDNNSKQQAQRESLESSEMMMEKANTALGTPPSVVDPSRRVFADRGIASPPDVEYGNDSNPDDLAIAIMIDDDEDDIDKKDVVYAVEYDPDSKPPMYRNRRFRLYGVVCTILVVVVAVVLAVSLSGDDPAVVTPTSPPTTSREFEFRSFFASEVGDSVFDEGTPHYMASEWILNEDPRHLELSDEALLQRFLLAFLYFHSTEMETSEWRSCGRPSSADTDSCTFMELTRNSDDSITYTPRYDRVRWLSGEDECSWNGVECPAGAGSPVGGINMFGQGLKGTLPTELAAFPFLQRVALAYNELTGTLPSEYGGMKYLLDLQVHGNALTGTIPSEFYEIESLQLLNVGANALVGTLDTRIGLLTDLKGLHLFENNMYGTFPTEIGELNFLAFLRVNGNEFSGTIPTELGSLGQITEFWFHENTFSGTIPSVLGNHIKNTDLRLWGNQLTGTIPDELYNLSELFRLSVRENALTGTLSPLVGQLTNLDILKVSRNQLTGAIPSEIQFISTLNVAWLHLNLFTGSVPTEICTLVPGEGSTEIGLSFLQADCNPTDDPPNPCLCCAGCCDRSTQVCTADETNE